MGAQPPLKHKQIRIKQLRAFCQAALTGSISEAAEQLFLSQPTVSLQIQALERELDTTLFERRGPKINLTPEGEIMLKLALPLVDGMDKLHETFTAQRGVLESGEVNIAAGESTIIYLLPEPLKQFSDTHPGIRVKLQNVTGGRDGLSRLRADEADFAVGAMPEVPDDIDYHPLVTFAPVLITPLGHPLSNNEKIGLVDISPYRLILPPPSLSTWRTVEAVFREHNLSFRSGLEAGGWEVIKKYVEMGMGISIVTDVCLTGRERLLRFQLDDYFPKRTYGIVLRKGKYLSPQASLLINILKTHYSAME